MMNSSFEPTKHYRPLFPQKNQTWKIIVAIVLLVGSVVAFFLVNPDFIYGPKYVAITLFEEKALQLSAENKYLKGQLTNLNNTLIELTNKFDDIYQLYQGVAPNQLTTLSNMITLTEENAALRTENAVLSKKIQTK